MFGTKLAILRAALSLRLVHAWPLLLSQPPTPRSHFTAFEKDFWLFGLFYDTWVPLFFVVSLPVPQLIVPC
jgi:hypothetical protein